MSARYYGIAAKKWGVPPSLTIIPLDGDTFDDACKSALEAERRNDIDIIWIAEASTLEVLRSDIDKVLGQASSRIENECPSI